MISYLIQVEPKFSFYNEDTKKMELRIVSKPFLSLIPLIGARKTLNIISFEYFAKSDEIRVHDFVGRNKSVVISGKNFRNAYKENKRFLLSFDADSKRTIKFAIPYSYLEWFVSEKMQVDINDNHEFGENQDYEIIINNYHAKKDLSENCVFLYSNQIVDEYYEEIYNVWW